MIKLVEESALQDKATCANISLVHKHRIMLVSGSATKRNISIESASNGYKSEGFRTVPLFGSFEPSRGFLLFG